MIWINVAAEQAQDQKLQVPPTSALKLAILKLANGIPGSRISRAACSMTPALPMQLEVSSSKT